MNLSPKTIITYLIDGNPQGIKTVELSNWIGKAISIPRAKLKEAKSRRECSQPALYFLFGKDDETDCAYIGEAENLLQRLSQHDTNKDFWDVVIAFVSKDNNLTKADVKFLEAEAVSRAKQVSRYKLLNGTSPSANNLPEYQESSIREFLSHIDLLISAMGYPILKALPIIQAENSYNSDTHPNDSYTNKIYYCTARGSNAKGIFTEEGMVVLKGSTGPASLVKSERENKQYAWRNRPKLIDKGVIKIEGEIIIFNQDYVFSSPSSAAVILTGRACNGWYVRKDKEGNTLDENERQALSD